MSDDGAPVTDPNYHSKGQTAVQTCGWTDNALRGEGRCYKHAFYGIRSHQCIQMTPVVKCNERCVFCWRDHAGHTYELEDAQWDDPETVVEASIRLQQKLLSGYGGNDEVPRERFEEAMEPRHVAISLDGEPTLYPHLPELLEAFHDRSITTFLVSNGSDPEMLSRCDPTQLYVSLDAPNESTFDAVVRPIEEDAWGRLLDTLDVLATKSDTRTALRTTLIEGHNMDQPDRYAALADRADIDFYELKAYMHVGKSRNRLARDAMPDHEDVLAFAESVLDHLPDHHVRKDSPPSRVALLARDSETAIAGIGPGSDYGE